MSTIIRPHFKTIPLHEGLAWGVEPNFVYEEKMDGVWSPQTFDLLITAKHDTKSIIQLSTLQGENRGWCACRAAFDRLKTGDIVEIEAFALTTKGLLREPRFIRPRGDKMNGAPN